MIRLMTIASARLYLVFELCRSVASLSGTAISQAHVLVQKLVSVRSLPAPDGALSQSPSLKVDFIVELVMSPDGEYARLQIMVPEEMEPVPCTSFYTSISEY